MIDIDDPWDVFSTKPYRYKNADEFLDHVRQALADGSRQFEKYRQQIARGEEERYGMLGWAAHSGFPLDVLQRLVALGAHPATPSKVPVGRWGSKLTHPIHEVLEDLESLAWIVKAGADLEARNEQGQTPLVAALLDINKPDHKGAVIDLLLGGGANPNVDVRMDTTTLERATLEHWRDQKPAYHEVPLLLCGRLTGPSTRNALLEAGADPLARTRFGETLMHKGLMEGGDVRRFQALGLKVDEVDAWGNSPLHALARGRHWFGMSDQAQDDIVGDLMNAGADINATNVYGDTALHLAHDLGVVRSLLDRGARIDIENAYRKTAVDVLRDRFGRGGKPRGELEQLLEHSTVQSQEATSLTTRLERALVKGSVPQVKACLTLGANAGAVDLELVDDLAPDTQVKLLEALVEPIMTGRPNLASIALAKKISQCESPAAADLIRSLGAKHKQHFEAVHPDYPILGSAMAMRGRTGSWREDNLGALIEIGCRPCAEDAMCAPTEKLRAMYYHAATPELQEQLARQRNYGVIASRASRATRAAAARQAKHT